MRNKLLCLLLAVVLTALTGCSLAQPEQKTAFEDRWIPLEEGYLAAVHPERGCDFVLDTTGAPVV